MEKISIGADGVIAEFPGYGYTDVAGTVVPASGARGFAPGCIFRDLNSVTAVTMLYVNAGTAASADFQPVVAGVDLSGLLATAAEINRVADVSTRLVSLTGSTNITEALHEGKTLLLNGTGAAFTQTLPQATGSGAKYPFKVGAVNTSNHIIAVGGVSDVFVGNLLANSTADAADAEVLTWLTSDGTTITLNGTTTGGASKGDWIEVEDIAIETWAIRGMITHSGDEATPFS